MGQLVILVAVGLFAAVAGAKTLSLSEDDLSAWEGFKATHNKVYESSGEELMRRSIFMKNKRHVEEFNSKNRGTKTFKIGLNHLSDLSDSEMNSRNGFKWPTGRPFKNNVRSEKWLQSILNNNYTDLPRFVDWHDAGGRVTDVKDQGNCSSGWAFASTGVLEGQMAVRDFTFGGEAVNSKVMLELSKQNLIDCVQEGEGCKSGNMHDALEFVYREGGIEDEKSYPYEAKSTGKCRFDKSKVAFSDKGATLLPMGDEEKLKEVVANFGPVAVAIDASDRDFKLYMDGVYYNDKCHKNPEDLNHAVLIVGYGDDKDYGVYWIIKNSWGEDWGLNGYGYMIRNHGNNCGIATLPTIPTF